MTEPSRTLPRSIVLVGNPGSGRARQGLERALIAIEQEGLTIVDRIPIHELERLCDWIDRPLLERPIIVAAGGDGTVGSVIGYVANTGTPLGILPLGTSNDVARSLSIPDDVEGAVHLL